MAISRNGRRRHQAARQTRQRPHRNRITTHHCFGINCRSPLDDSPHDLIASKGSREVKRSSLTLRKRAAKSRTGEVMSVKHRITHAHVHRGWSEGTHCSVHLCLHRGRSEALPRSRGPLVPPCAVGSSPVQCPTHQKEKTFQTDCMAPVPLTQNRYRVAGPARWHRWIEVMIARKR